MMTFHVATIYPALIEAYAQCGITARAIAHKRISIYPHNIREYTQNKHGKVDDYVYGGGPGMLMTAQPVVDCIETLKKQAPAAPVIYFTPKGERFCSKLAKELCREETLILLCGHYEGIDERALEILKPREISLGDYILTGGHIAAITLIDAVMRYVPGVLGSAESAQAESFEKGLLEHPQYTRPSVFRGLNVPEVLLQGDHAKVEAFNKEKALEETKKKRRDLLEKNS